MAVFGAYQLCIRQVEDKTDSITCVADSLLACFEGSHPLVPKRKQSTHELKRGPIYPSAEAEKWTSIMQDGNSSPLPNQIRKKSQNSSPKRTNGNTAEGGIRIDPSLEVLFTDVAPDGRAQTTRRKTLGLLNPT